VVSVDGLVVCPGSSFEQVESEIPTAVLCKPSNPSRVESIVLDGGGKLIDDGIPQCIHLPWRLCFGLSKTNQLPETLQVFHFLWSLSPGCQHILECTEALVKLFSNQERLGNDSILEHINLISR